MLRLLRNRNFVFLLAMALGLLFPQAARFGKPVILWALAFVMMLATLKVPNDFFRSFRAAVKSSLAGILMSYLVLGGVILILSALFIDNELFRIGFVLIAAVPPAVAVIPFSGLLGGNVSHALAGSVAAYLGALVIMPVVFISFLGRNLADPTELVWIISLLIFFPVILSRIIIRLNLDRWLASRGGLTDWSFFIVLYTIIAANNDLLTSKPMIIAPSALLAFAATFVLGFIIEKTSGFLKVDRKERVHLMLFGTMKNLGMAGGIALSLFEKETALPAAVYNIFMILYFIWLDLRGKTTLASTE